MNLEDVKKFLEENQEDEQVKAYLGELKQPTKEDVEGFLDTEEGKKILQPRLDKYHNKSLESWKKNNLDKLVDDKVKEIYPEESEEQKKIRKLEQQFEERDRELKLEKLRNKAVSQASEKGLPTGIVEFFLDEDEEKTDENLNTLQEVWNQSIQAQKEQLLKDNGVDLKEGQQHDKTLTYDQLQTMSTEEVMKLDEDVVNAAMANKSE